MKQSIYRRLSACLPAVSFAGCIAAILLVAVGCSRAPAQREPGMDVPDSETVAFTQMEQANTAAWAEAQPETAPVFTSRELELSAGGTATLYAFETGSEPLVAADDITSLSGSLILNSAGVQTSEDISALDLAENELRRWVGSAGLEQIKYTQPLRISEGRYLVCLEITGTDLHSKQVVVFTDLNAGLARIDRLWHTVDDATDEGDAAFDAAANYLISENTLRREG